MSLTLTLSGKSTVLAANYFPVIDFSDGDYELGLAIFETYHTILNVNKPNNKFYFAKDDMEITIPESSYEVRDINEYLKRAILRKRPHRDALETVDVVFGDNKNNDADDDNGEGGEYPITLRANYNTMRCEIRCAYRINFDKHWIAAGILVEAYTATTKIARVGHVDQHNECKRYLRRVT